MAPLVNVETEVNGDSKSTNELVRWACQGGTRDSNLALAALVSPVQKIFFLTAEYFNLCVSVAQQPGQAVVQGRLSLNVCLRSRIRTMVGQR